MRTSLIILIALTLTGCIKPGQYTDANGNELRNNCPIQTMCLDVSSNRPSVPLCTLPGSSVACK